MSLKVVVCGGGIGGLTFSLCAARRGISVTLVERFPRLSGETGTQAVPRSIGGGIGLWPNSQRVLHGVGVLPELDRVGAYMQDVAYLDTQGRTLAAPKPDFEARYPVLCLERDDLCDRLWEACEKHPNITCEIGTIDAVASDPEVSVSFKENGKQIVGDVLVGADGIHSVIRNEIQRQHGRPPIEAVACGYAYFRAVVDASLGSTWKPTAFESWGQGLRFGYVPLGRSRAFWFGSVPVGDSSATRIAPNAGAQRCSEVDKDMLLDEFGDWGAPVNIQELITMTKPQSILRTDIYKIPADASSSWSRFPWTSPQGNIVLIGDAAHATAPNLAQGAGLAIEDAAVLADRLSSTGTCPSAIRSAVSSYESARVPRAKTVQTMADLVAHAGHLQGYLASARDHVLRVIQRIPPLAALQRSIFELAVRHSLGGGRNALTWTAPLSHGDIVPRQQHDCLLGLVLGRTEFERLPLATRQFRGSQFGGQGTGTVSVESFKLWQWLAGLPAQMENKPFDASVECNGDGSQTWTRVFGSGEPGAVAYSTTHRATPSLAPRSGHVLTESLSRASGIRFGYQVSVDGDGQTLNFKSTTGLWLGDNHVPLPWILSPASSWKETPLADGSGGWHFDGKISLPPVLGGVAIMKYRGDFRPQPQWPESGLGGSDNGLGDSDNGLGDPDNEFGDSDTKAGRSNGDRANHPQRLAIVSGGRGLVGEAVCKQLSLEGYEVVVLSRSPPVQTSRPLYVSRVVQWDGRTDQGWSQLIQPGVPTVLVNLAGENPGSGRWTASKKQHILDSRLNAIRAFGAAIDESKRRGCSDTTWIQSSAVGVYGSRPGEVLTDASSPASTTAFRETCCVELERAATTQAKQSSVPLTILRFGHVLSSRGGILPHFELASTFRNGRLGHGDQYVPWVHVTDVARVVAAVPENEGLQGGTVNVTSPNPVTNKELLVSLGKARGRRFCIFPVPAALLKAAFGESSAAVLDSENVVPSRLVASGFEFRYPDLQKSLVSRECLPNS